MIIRQPVALWEFDGNLNDVNATSSLSINFGGSIDYVTGKIGQAFRGLALGTAVQKAAPIGVLDVLGGSFSISTWQQTNQLFVSDGPKLTYYRDAASLLSIYGVRAGFPAFVRYTAEAPGLNLTWEDTSTNSPVGLKHIAFTFDDATGTARLYVHGALRASGSASFSAAGSTALFQLESNSVSSLNFLRDQTAIFNFQLSAGEVRGIYNGGRAVPWANPWIVGVQPGDAAFTPAGVGDIAVSGRGVGESSTVAGGVGRASISPIGS